MLKKFSLNIILIFITLFLIELIFAIFFITRPNPTISLIFKPFFSYEKIEFLSRVEHFDYETNKYKPGLYRQVKAFISSYGIEHLCSIEEHQKNIHKSHHLMMVHQ
mgnify:CR=1 FL=1